ncbi:L-xylulose reductase-like [Cylas formicarius]|uniref:L-xylulose reductase-like n=1 Tax=Cylas formicarius TaxID=197179 RepID=UPI0029588832|nr:L-xylulose reductase-like [Cylas formicarius]
MDISFSGKRALVTGAGSGIGRGVAIRLLKGGAKVIALDKNAEALATLRQEFPLIETVQADLTDWDASKTAIKLVLPIDLLVNNAGIATVDPVTDVTAEKFDSTFHVNVRSLFLVSQTVVEDLLNRKSTGAIVNTSSQAARAGLLHRTLYCSSKGAVDAFTRALAIELGPHNIRVNAVNPTVVLTELGKQIWSEPAKKEWMLSKIPLNRFAEIEDVENAIVFLLSDNAAMITGTCLPIDGGFLAC